MTVDSENVVIWLHADNLSPYSPALMQMPDAPAIFVWDEALLAEWRISLKRIVFIYECLLALPVTIRKGDVVGEVANFALEHDARLIVTNASVSPRHAMYCRGIAERMPKGSRLRVLEDVPFVAYDGRIDLKRFSRYWYTVKDRVLKR